MEPTARLITCIYMQFKDVKIGGLYMWGDTEAVCLDLIPRRGTDRHNLVKVQVAGARRSSRTASGWVIGHEPTLVRPARLRTLAAHAAAARERQQRIDASRALAEQLMSLLPAGQVSVEPGEGCAQLSLTADAYEQLAAQALEAAGLPLPAAPARVPALQLLEQLGLWPGGYPIGVDWCDETFDTYIPGQEVGEILYLDDEATSKLIDLLAPAMAEDPLAALFAGSE